MPHKILVFPCGSEIGLEIHNSLRFSTHIELYGASSEASNHGKYVYKNYTEGLPDVQDASFIAKLNDIIEENRIDFLFPAHDSVVVKASQRALELKCRVIGSEYQTCRICRDKKLTYEAFDGVIPTPKVYAKTGGDILYPVFLKPAVGQGSKGTCIAHSRQDVDFYVQKDPSLLVLEYLPGMEFTVDCFTDRHGRLRFAGGRKRHRVLNGISVDTYPVSDKRFAEYAGIINGKLALRGAWFFQVKERASGEPVLMEIAPRIAGAMGLHRNRGVNLPLLSVFDACDENVEIVDNKFSLTMDRALCNRFSTDISFTTVYIDFDDTLVFNEKVNPLIVLFLYQCFNRGKKIRLLSRHAGNIGEALQKFRIGELFDEIIIVGPGGKKSAFIADPCSLFIDDSFSERLEVRRKCGIPTFDSAAIECLIDWRS